MKKYLIWFVHEHVEFRHAELQSLIELLGAKLEFLERKIDGRRLWMVDTSEEFVEPPWMIVACEELEHILNICRRSILIRYVIELYAQGESFEEVVNELKQQDIEAHDDLFKFEVEAFGRRKISREEKVAKMERLSFLPLNGSVSLKDYKHAYYIIEYYGQENNVFRENPLRVFFGRLVAEGRRDLVDWLSLKKRLFIANTSMDPTLSIVMSNMAKSKEADLVFDPFVGSASLLVAAALHGAYVLGMDIDFLLLHGRAKPSRCKVEKRQAGESVYNNLKQYGVEKKYLDVIVGDSSLPVLRHLTMNAILTDPPYGIRESTERIGTRKNKYGGLNHAPEDHYPSKVSYNLDEVVRDLMKFSAATLPIGGRLVFWIPVFREDFIRDLDRGKACPKHPCFSMVACSEQRLTTHSSRMLFTFEKVKELEESDLQKLSDPSLSLDQDQQSFRDKYFGKYDPRISP
ncbi:tRNA (guanine(10)-N2)-methyltransferase homolog [Galendromus occidentalis]|uniref:tRNA (guanine(10)-N(2))-methyltransferase TRMT11 n=1 Tax=Galendromus occidentalis TaxID=34638 RepID=A0AAJ6QNL9_9ACAR|nr:tRNA (guanine(10)-N2)-methyltransferase homolog [Galendromus occidentalis]